ncbi:hypothetical protein NQ317_018589 [Molorchus minor]|uniref:Uncharacterized protein n=1 Tax=Molorchus minor TaxID=1323400 RepID=A0ABQ9IYI6_9CUCU|nr:hypothetical protein NQ317_018589 [Molorchus minor]
MPGLFFKYDVSALQITVKQQKRPRWNVPLQDCVQLLEEFLCVQRSPMQTIKTDVPNINFSSDSTIDFLASNTYEP